MPRRITPDEVHTPKQIYFYHMPKTGGGSVSAMLSKCISPRDAKNITHNLIKVKGGHTMFHKGRKEAPKDGTVMTWLRNPVDVTYSAYSYFGSPERVQRGHGRPRPKDVLGRVIWDIEHTATLEHYVNEVEFPYPHGWWPEVDQFDFLGVTELMEKSMSALSKQIDVEIPYDDTRLNTSKYDRKNRPGEERLMELFRKERAEWERRYNEVGA